jgi:hypothetical protein
MMLTTDPMPCMLLSKWMILWMLLLSLPFHPQNGIIPRFVELMADYKTMCTSHSDYHNSFAERMVEEMKKSLTNTYPHMLYLNGFLEANQSLMDTCLSSLPLGIFSETTSGAPCQTVQKKGRGRHHWPGGKGGNKPSLEAGMQSQVLALVPAKNAVLAHATAAQLVAATMTNKQS